MHGKNHIIDNFLPIKSHEKNLLRISYTRKQFFHFEKNSRRKNTVQNVHFRQCFDQFPAEKTQPWFRKFQTKSFDAFETGERIETSSFDATLSLVFVWGKDKKV